MGKEATLIVIDNSEWMRNGDFSPSRFEAQNDAVNLICGTKIRQNAENTVGLISSAGRAVEVCSTLTTDPAKILAAFHKVKLAGETDFLGAIQVGALALRHRQNKKQEQRIIVFVGSPVTDSIEQIKKTGAMLRKNKVAVDIVNFGEENVDGNTEKLQAFHNAVNNHDNSFFITIPPGTSQLAESLVNTPIIRSTGGEDAGQPPVGMEFGVDPNMDPELLMALRLSVQTAEDEARARQGPGEGEPAQPGEVEMKDAQNVDNREQQNSGDVDPDIAAAIAMSMGGGGQDNMDVDPDIAAAIALSLQTAQEDKKEGTENQEKEGDEDMSNISSESIADALLSLPGIDSSDPNIQALLKGSKKDEEKKDEK